MNTSAGCVQRTRKNRSDTARVQTPQNTFDGCALLHHRHHTILNREGGGRRANMDVPYHLIKGTLVQPSELSMIGSGNLHRSSREASTQEIPVRIRAPAYPYQHPSIQDPPRDTGSEPGARIQIAHDDLPKFAPINPLPQSLRPIPLVDSIHWACWNYGSNGRPEWVF